MDKTPLHQLADERLGGAGATEKWIADRRSRGMSWRKITRELLETTGVDVTHETMRAWFR